MDKHALRVQHAAKADDPYFHAVLYDTLVDMRATAQLLQLDSPLLERHLRSSGGLPDRGAPPPGAAIGPLSPTQVPASVTLRSHSVTLHACDCVHCNASGHICSRDAAGVHEQSCKLRWGVFQKQRGLKLLFLRALVLHRWRA